MFVLLLVTVYNNLDAKYFQAFVERLDLVGKFREERPSIVE